MRPFHSIQWLLRRKIDFLASKKAMESCEIIISEMGAEIHDDLIQRLSILKLRIDRLQLEHGQCSDEAGASIQQLQDDYKTITESVRRISRRLHPTRIDGESFETTLLALCQNIDGPGSSRIKVQVQGTPVQLPDRTEIYLIRMIQELVHNALRHSSAWHLWVRVTWAITTLRIEVEDDGTGFARLDEFISRLKNKNNTLRMRAMAIGADLQYKKGDSGLLALITYRL